MFLRQSCPVARAAMLWHNLNSLQPLPPGSRDPHTSASQAAETTGPPPCLANLFYFILFLVEAISCYVAQAGLDLLNLTNPPASASQSKC